MRKSILSVAILFATGLFTQSCKDNTLDPSTTDSERYLSFKGEKVRIPEAFPEELFDQTQEQLEAYINSKVSRNAREASGARLTYDELGEILNRSLAKYPRVNYDSISHQDFKRILIDIPSIKSMEDALAKVEIIFDYYNTLAKNDVISDVVSLEKRKTGLKVSGPSPGSLTDPERNILLGNPAFAVAYVNAAGDANLFTSGMWSVDEDNKKNNAFKHSIWNCLIIRYIITSTPASKTNAINFAQNGTSAHEMNDDGSHIHDAKAAMDLHNNQSARNWMDDEVRWGIGPLRKMPSVSKILDTWYARANSATYYDQATNWTGILVIHGGNNSTTWNNLYNNLYGGHQHNVYIEN